MTGEPLFAQHASSQPPVAFEHIGLAERFASFAEYAAYTESSPQSGAASLDVARLHAFTGELTFDVEYVVRLYLDGGSVYYAERDGAPSVGEMLLDAKVLDTVQLQRGVVRVGDLDHLGRLFDRDATVDRDAVMVVVEGSTDVLVQAVAVSTAATVVARAYRHHPTGLHRWFVGPGDATASRRPASGVMQIDRTVVDDLPQLAGSVPPADADVAVDVDLERFDTDRADWSTSSNGTARDSASDEDAAQDRDAVTDRGSETDSSDDFHVVWPDGSRDLAGAESSAAPPLESPSQSAQSTATPVPVVERTSPPPSAASDEVATAVRRALDALGPRPDGSQVSGIGEQRRVLSLADVHEPTPVDATGPTAPREPEPMGFPPPTLETSAAAIYERAAAAAAAASAAPPAMPSPDAVDVADLPPGPEPDRPAASEDAGGDITGRRSALRRLIGSLRARD